MSIKNPVTSAGIETATFRFVAQHLNCCATAVPHKTNVWIQKYRNTSLKMATKGDRNMLEVHSVHTEINSHIFVCSCWLYHHNVASVHGNEIFKIILCSVLSEMCSELHSRLRWCVAVWRCATFTCNPRLGSGASSRCGRRFGSNRHTASGGKSGRRSGRTCAFLDTSGTDRHCVALRMTFKAKDTR